MPINVPPGPAAPIVADTASSASRTPGEAVLEMRGVTVDFGAHRVLDDLHLAVGRGELIALLGPSGSGKTTAIRTIAGFQAATSGSVLLAGKELAGTPVHRRGIGMVFQSYALFPHLTVAQNIAYPMTIRRANRSSTRRRVEELVELVQLTGHAHKRPAGLSGGQQQRVALARALAMEPELLLLDEPLSNLDANLRREVGEEIRRLQQRTGTTAVMVTHDRQEAFGMADRIAVLRGGRIEQLDVPEVIYRRPATRFMAEFVGDANLLPATVFGSAGEDRVRLRTEWGQFTATGTAVTGSQVLLLLRPEDLTVLPPRTAVEQFLDARVLECFYYGSSVVAHVEASGTSLQVVTSGTAVDSLVVGAQVRLGVRPQDATIIPAKVTS